MADDVVPIVNSDRLDTLLGAIEHDLLRSTDGDPRFGHHPFIENGLDKAPRKKAKSWVLSHLPPGGK